MRFDDRFLDEVKSRVRLSDVIGKTVKLKRQGREFVGLSPFTSEKSPSFFVNDDKGFFHDFSSGMHGDLISFLQETEKLSFVEAVERLAGEAGLQLPERDAHTAQQDQKRQGLAEWLSLAAVWFEGELRRPIGKAAREYLSKRGLPEAEWTRFKLGYAPSGRTSLKDYLVAKGAKPGDLVEAGLLISPEDGSAPYDRFRDRIIFPIADARGRIVSFGGRALDPAAKAKYLNGPETSLFSKGRVLYGLSEARKLLNGPEERPLVVVEGYMDVIACQRAGIPAVAPLGTALTEEQMEALWRLQADPILSFDGDKAGQRAAARAIERALPLLKPGKSFRFAVVAGGKDADDILREQGPAALREQLDKTTPFVEALFAREMQSESHHTPEGIAAIKQKLKAAAGSIQDRDLAEQYRRHLMLRFEEHFPSSYYGRDRVLPRGNQHFIEPNAGKILQRRIRRFNATVAIGALHKPAWLLPFTEQFAQWGFGDERLEPLMEPFLECLLTYDADPEILTRLIHKHDAAGIIVRASKIANEVPAPPFFDERLAEAERQPAWEHCYGTMIDLALVEAALLRDREVLDTDDAAAHSAFFQGRQQLLQTQRRLRKVVNDLDWFYGGEAERRELAALRVSLH